MPFCFYFMLKKIKTFSKFKSNEKSLLCLFSVVPVIFTLWEFFYVKLRLVKCRPVCFHCGLVCRLHALDLFYVCTACCCFFTQHASL